MYKLFFIKLLSKCKLHNLPDDIVFIQMYLFITLVSINHIWDDNTCDWHGKVRDAENYAIWLCIIFLLLKSVQFFGTLKGPLNG